MSYVSVKWQTIWTHVRLFLQELFDLCPRCLTRASKTFQQTSKADDFCCDYALCVKRICTAIQGLNFSPFKCMSGGSSEETVLM